MKLTELDCFPQSLLDISPEDLHHVLNGPTLIHVKGRIDPPLFVVTLLHGNELTGFYAIQSLMNDYLDRELPRSLSIFIGNVQAVKDCIRCLPNQQDYNRIWDGGTSPLHQLANQVKHIMKKRGVFVSIDIHNNSGLNPYFSCTHVLDDRHFSLCRLFSKRLVYFTEPRSVQSKAFSTFCPALVIECGLFDNPKGIEYVKHYLDQCLSLRSLEDLLIKKHDLLIYHSKANITIPKDVTIGFESDSGPLHFRFVDCIETFNFQVLPPDTLIGWRLDSSMFLNVLDENGHDVGNDYLSYSRHDIRLKKSIIPSMFTKNINIIYQDCLGYIMEELS